MTPTSTDDRMTPARLRIRRAVRTCLVGAGLAFLTAAGPAQDFSAPPAADGPLLRFLGLVASPESIDYVVNKSQFQLHTLLTEQRHPKTWTLSEKIRTDTAAGLKHRAPCRIPGIVVEKIGKRLCLVKQALRLSGGVTVDIVFSLFHQYSL